MSTLRPRRRSDAFSRPSTRSRRRALVATTLAALGVGCLLVLASADHADARGAPKWLTSLSRFFRAAPMRAASSVTNAAPNDTVVLFGPKVLSLGAATSATFVEKFVVSGLPANTLVPQTSGYLLRATNGPSGAGAVTGGSIGRLPGSTCANGASLSNEAIMSEGHTYRCSWALTTTGYRLWVVADPALVREDAVFAEAAEELGYAILDKTGDGEAQLEFEPPPPGTELRPPALLRLWKLGLHATVRFGNARESYEGGLCDNCLMPLGPRTRVPLDIVTPLPKSHLLESQMADAGIGVGPSPRIFSPGVVAMLTDEERACFEWRPVRAEGRETKYLELIHRIPPTPQVAPLGATARHSRCETCGYTSVYVEQVGNEPNRFISTRELPDPLPPALAMGTVANSGLLISDARRREMLAQKGSRWLTSEPVSVIPESLVDRSPVYLPRRRARRKE